MKTEKTKSQWRMLEGFLNLKKSFFKAIISLNRNLMNTIGFMIWGKRKVSIKWMIFLVFLFSNIISKSQTYQLKQDKVISGKEKLLQRIEKRLKSTSYISFSINNELIPPKTLQNRDNRFFKKLFKTIKKYPDSVEPFIKLGAYYKQIGEKEISKQYYEKSLKLLQTKTHIKDSIEHYLKLAIVKKELSQKMHEEINFVVDRFVNDGIAINEKYIFFVFTSLLGYDKHKEAKQKAIQLLDNKLQSPGAVYIALLGALVLEKGLAFGQPEFLILDKYSKLYQNNDTVQNIRMLANLYPLLFKLPSFYENNMEHVKLTNTAQDLKELDSIEKYLEESFSANKISKYAYHKYSGYVSFFKEDRQNAINHFEKSIESLSRDQKNIQNIDYIYDMLFTLYNYENIKKITEQRIVLSKGNDKLLAIEYHKLAQMYFEKSNFEKALDLCLEAKHKDDKNSDIFSLLAHLEFKKGESSLGLNYYLNQALEHADTNTRKFTVYLQYAVYNMFFNDATQAREAIKLAGLYTND